MTYHKDNIFTNTSSKTTLSCNIMGYLDDTTYFSNSLPHLKNQNHYINTKDAKPIYQKACLIPLVYREWLKIEIKEMEESSIIKETSSPWSSSIVLVPKKGS